MIEGKSDAGFVLVGVLIFVLILSLLASIALVAARNNTRHVTHEIERAKAAAAADAAIELALAAILDPAHEPDGWALNRSVRIPYKGVDVVVVVSGESGKLDINKATSATLRSGFEALGLEDKRAAELADRIVDWRDIDDFRSLNGAEEADYKSAGLKEGPANRPFLTVDEVRRVLGVTARIYDCIKADLTVFSKRAGLDLESLSDRLSDLRLHQSAERQASDVVRRKQGGQRITGDVVRIEAEAHAPSGLTVMKRRIVRLTGNRSDPVEVLSVESGLPIEPGGCQFNTEGRSDTRGDPGPS